MAGNASQAADAASLFPANDSEPLEVDEEDWDGDSALYGSVDGSSANTSLKSFVRDYIYENGRRYHSYRQGEYLMPNDDREQER